VRTTVVCPSFFATNLADGMRATDPAFEVIARQMIAGVLPGGPKLTADEVARKVLRAVARERFWSLPHIEGRALWLLKRYLPPVFNAGMSMGAQLLDRLAARPAAEGTERRVEQERG
jgi:hypothetical protein